jgi:hypothetical protein
MKIALILRHMAASQLDQEQQTELLIESLDYDPDDKACYLQILRHYSQRPEANKTYQQWQSKALAKFPEDIEMLTQALQAAIRSKAHTKVIQHALQIIKIDSLNSFAKQALFSSYLTQARLLIQSKKYHLVQQEITLAENLKMGKRYTLETQLLRGFLCFAAQDKNQGL